MQFAVLALLLFFLCPFQMSDVMESFPLPAPAFNGNSRVIVAGGAFEWLRQGWALFAVNPGIWIITTIVLLIVITGLYFVPLFGALAVRLLTPLLGAGLLRACQKTANDEVLEIADLLAGFKLNTVNLILLGALYTGAMLIIGFIVFVIAGVDVAGEAGLEVPAGSGFTLGGLMLAGLFYLALSVPLLMAMWFAPALVFFNNMSAVDALRASFSACLKNALPFLVYGLIVSVLVFFAALPAGLGFPVLIPVLAGSLYASYRDIFLAI